jgi:hypothetical protein
MTPNAPKDNDQLARFLVFFFGERKYEISRYVTFPDSFMASHFPDSERGVTDVLPEKLKFLRCLVFDRLW